MDTRIYELAKQAGYKVKTYWTSDDNHKTLAQTEHYMKDDVLEKFAELIVKECGYHADIFDGLGCPGDMDPLETKPSDYIKTHFGVEE